MSCLSSMKKTEIREALIISFIWFSPWLWNIPDFSLSLCASSTKSASKEFSRAVTKLPEERKRDLISVIFIRSSFASSAVYTFLGAEFLETYAAVIPFLTASARRFTASTLFPVPGPPSITKTCFESDAFTRFTHAMMFSKKTFWSSSMTNSLLPLIILVSTS